MKVLAGQAHIPTPRFPFGAEGRPESQVQSCPLGRRNARWPRKGEAPPLPRDLPHDAENWRHPRFAWRILADGVCDGCALGTTGMRDFTVPGVHLCTVRLNLLKLNMMGPLDVASSHRDSKP